MMTRKHKQKDEEVYFDDCPICQAMKEMGMEMEYHNDEDEVEEDGLFAPDFRAAPLNEKQLAQLKEAFKKAKESGAIVGGKWFEKENNDGDNKKLI